MKYMNLKQKLYRHKKIPFPCSKRKDDWILSLLSRTEFLASINFMVGTLYVNNNKRLSTWILNQETNLYSSNKRRITVLHWKFWITKYHLKNQRLLYLSFLWYVAQVEISKIERSGYVSNAFLSRPDWLIEGATRS